MSKSIQVFASILCSNFLKLGDEIKRAEDAGVDGIHVDVMDGHFVPNISIGHVIVEAIRPVTKLPIETHLMIEHPGMYIDDFINLGADIVSIQVECYGPLRKASQGLGKFPKEVDKIDQEKMRKDILRIKAKGKKAHAVINPGTPLCLGDLVNDLDGVLIMSVNPGFAKQKFIADVLPKVRELRKVFKGDIAIDGGVNGESAPLAVKAGVNILATASYFFGASDPQSIVKHLKELK